MGLRILSCLVLLILIGCQQKTPQNMRLGDWVGVLRVSEKEVLPFNFSLNKDGKEDFLMEIKNGEERIIVDEISIANDSILIKLPVFEGYLAGTFTENSITGQFVKESLERYVPFAAKHGVTERFKVTADASHDISGVWETTFSYDSEDAYKGKGIFYQNDNTVTGTFRTTTGDYRYLDGVMNGDTLKLSAFDGAHAFLFTAHVGDGILEGTFYSGNHYQEKFIAKRNNSFELPNADVLTFIKEGYETFDFSFPNSDGELVSPKDKQFKDKVVLVQIMGTWCPNCLDETKFYVEYLKNNPNQDLEIIGLAFEYARTEEKAFEAINRLKERVGVDYPILLAQVGTSSKEKANEKLPMLNQVLSYPTTIYIDKKGDVRKIHTGFNGPATGETYEAFTKKFSKTLALLLNE